MTSITNQNGIFFAEVVGFEKTIKLPSQMFPINGIPKMFVCGNTEDCDDFDVIGVFDSITADVGRCYSNAEIFLSKAAERGIAKSRIMSYVGWLFIGNSMPVHHCFVLVDGKHLLDFATDLKSEDYMGLANKNTDEVRSFIVERHFANKQKPNSVVYGRGMVDTLYCILPHHAARVMV